MTSNKCNNVVSPVLQLSSAGTPKNEIPGATLLLMSMSKTTCTTSATSLHKKWNFPLRISSINMTKSAENCGFGHIYWRNPYWKLHFLCSASCWISKSKGTSLMKDSLHFKAHKSTGLVEFLVTAMLRLITCNICNRVFDSIGSLPQRFLTTPKICKIYAWNKYIYMYIYVYMCVLYIAYLNVTCYLF